METLLHAAFNNAVSAAFLALLVACLGRVLARRPAILHCLWLLVLLKLVSPPLYEVSIPWPEGLSVSPQHGARLDSVYLELIDEIKPTVPVGDPQLFVRDDGPDATVLPERATGIERVSLHERMASQARVAGAWLSGHWTSLAALIWLAGSVATAVICARRIHRFQRMLRESQPASDDIQDWVDELALRLGIERPPLVFWIGGRLSPMLWALGRRARLIIPTDLWKGLNQQERATLIVHELAHLRRGDHHVRLFELLVTVLCWWNPVLWWARQALRDVEEQCCDAWVVWAFPDAARSYAETLLETLDFLNQSELSEPLLASGFGKVHHLRRRLTMIMSGTTSRVVSLWGGLGSLSLAILLLPLNASWAQQPEKPQEVEVVVKASEDSPKPNDEVVEIQSADGSTLAAKVVTVDVRGGKPPLTLVESGAGSGQATFVLEATADDSSVRVTAESADDAINKVKDQLKELRQKSSLNDKEKDLLKLLESAQAQLEQGKAAPAGGVVYLRAKPENPNATGAKAYVVRRAEVTNAAVSPEKKAEIEKLRGEVNQLSEKLAAAQAKLSQLEGGASHALSYRFVTKGDANVPVQVYTRERLHAVQTPIGVKNSQGKSITIRKIHKNDSSLSSEASATSSDAKPTNDGQNELHGRLIVHPPIKYDGERKVSQSDDQRIQELEKTLKKLMEEVDSLKKTRVK